VDSVEPRDPLLFFEPLPLEQLFWPLGFPVRVRTNSQIVLDAANASWGECRSRFDTKPIEIHAGVHGLEGGATPPMPVYRSLDYLLTGTATPHDSFVSDLRQGRSFGWVTPAAVADFAYYRYAFLEAMAYLPLAALHLAPIHCAAVEFDGQAVLLCGNSGAGKSSLSYACARRGWTYICDDAAYLVRKEQQPRVVGASFSIRLRDEARRLFPEIEAKVPTRRGNGAIRLELRTAELPNWKTAEQGTVRHIVFLDRGQPIGLVGPLPSGGTGVYFELRVDGRAVDPLQWLKR